MCNLSEYVEEQGIEKIIDLYNWLKENNRVAEATAILEK